MPPEDTRAERSVTIPATVCYTGADSRRTERRDYQMPPLDWNHKDDEWKDVLKKPKNLGLRAVGTGVGALLRAAHNADHAFSAAMAGGHQTMQSFRALGTALDNLGKKCKEISDKHKKLFTEACTSLDGYRQQAV